MAPLALVIRQCGRRQEENKKQKRHFWVRKNFTKETKKRGEWEDLFRVSLELFEHLQKKHDCKKRLVITLRYLGEGCSQQALSLEFSNVSQLSHSISLVSNYRQKLATENCHFFILIS